MRKRALLLSLLLLLLPAWAGAQQSNAKSTPLNGAVAKVLKVDQLQRSKVGIHVVDLDSGDVLYSMNADEAFNPASNMKLLTAAAALDKFGPQFVFGTRLSATGVRGEKVVGPLYLKGEGDPLLLWEDLLALASELHAQGIREIPDGIVVDDTAFAEGFIPPGYDQKDEDAPYRAPIGAVSLNFNSVTAVVTPASKAGSPATVRLDPPAPHVRIEGTVKTQGGNAQKVRAKSKSQGDGTVIEVSGSIGVQADSARLRKRIDNPSMFTGSALKSAFGMVGISVGEVKRGVRPQGTRTLAYHESKPLAYVVQLMNKWSNNFMAEQLFRHLGSGSGAATTESARDVAAAFMRKTGAAPQGFVSFNGSGLYDGNTITPKQVVTLLTYMSRHRFAAEFAASLPIAGTDGTLKSRLRDASTTGTLRGKTGTLNQVSALGGYLQTKGGRRVAYCILFNETPVKAWHLRAVQDEIAIAIASFGG